MHFSSKLLIFKGSGKSTEKNTRNFVKFLQEKKAVYLFGGSTDGHSYIFILF